MDAVEEVVGGHDGPDVGFLDGGFKGGEVDFVEGALVDVGVDAVALELLVVGGEVLEGGEDALALDAADVGVAEAGGEPGILAVPLKIAAPDGDAVDVDGGAEDHVAAVGAGFRTDGCALLLDEIGIPGGSHGDAGGEGGGEDWGCGSCGVGDEG